MKNKINNMLFLAIEIFALGGIPLVLIANYPGQIAAVMERFMLYLLNQSIDNLGKTVFKFRFLIKYFMLCYNI